MNYNEEEITEIKEALQLNINHPYLTKFIKVPEVQEEKISLLYHILKEANLPYKQLKCYVVSTMLVQIALDIHETVTLSEQTDDELSLKHRQLSVLAGDYYSGLYYKMLADLKDLPMIQTLAEAIKVVNEEKISIYNKEQHGCFDSVFHKVKVIETLLIQQVVEHVQLPIWKDLSAELIFLKKLLKEKEAYSHSGRSNMMSLIKLNSISVLDSYILQTKETIVNLIKNTTNANVKSIVKQVFDDDFHMRESVLEEG